MHRWNENSTRIKQNNVQQTLWLLSKYRKAVGEESYIAIVPIYCFWTLCRPLDDAAIFCLSHWPPHFLASSTFRPSVPQHKRTGQPAPATDPVANEVNAANKPKKKATNRTRYLFFLLLLMMMMLINGELIRCGFNATCRRPRGGSRTCRQWPLRRARRLMVGGQQCLLVAGGAPDAHRAYLPIVHNRFVDHGQRMRRHFGICGWRRIGRIVWNGGPQQRGHWIVAGIAARVYHCTRLYDCMQRNKGCTIINHYRTKTFPA